MGDEQEDLTGLKNTITALREELRQTKQKYQGIEDPLAAIAAMQELATIKPQYEALQTEKATLQEQLTTTALDAATSAALTGVNPDFRELLYGNIRAQLKIGETGTPVAADGRSIDQLRTDYETKYPSMFLAGTAPIPAGSGAAPNNGAPPSAPVTVQAEGGVIKGVNPQDVIDKKVKIS